MVKTPAVNAGDVGSIPGWATKILRAAGCGQKINKKAKTKIKLIKGAVHGEGRVIKTWTFFERCCIFSLPAHPHVE